MEAVHRAGRPFRAAVTLVATAAMTFAVVACGPGRLGLTEYASTVQAGQLTAADGYIEPNTYVSPFENFHPAIGNLKPELRTALQQAASDAAEEQVEILVTDGWRSERYQKVLFNSAIRMYASREEAQKWVATPEQSRHVSGEAVDIGPPDANSWLGQHGWIYGLCQTYANEPWHFELVTEPGGVCPTPAPDATAG